MPRNNAQTGHPLYRGQLKAVARFLAAHTCDVKQLEGFEPPRYCLRIGDWRFVFRKAGDGTIEVIRVCNRREAYR